MATESHCVYCFDSLISHFEKVVPAPPSFPNDKYPLFVTWHKESRNGTDLSLRGCKGTFSSKEVHSGLQEFSLISALKDKRFSPVSQSELPKLECTVSLLFQFENCTDVYDWEIGTHGIIIDFTDPRDKSNRNATYLPEVALEQKWTKEETVESLAHKAGYDGPLTKAILKTIQTTRYQSSISKLAYEDYINHKKNPKDEGNSNGYPSKKSKN